MHQSRRRKEFLPTCGMNEYVTRPVTDWFHLCCHLRLTCLVTNHLHAGKETDPCDTTVAFSKAVWAARSANSLYSIPEWLGIHLTDTATSWDLSAWRLARNLLITPWQSVRCGLCIAMVMADLQSHSMVTLSFLQLYVEDRWSLEAASKATAIVIVSNLGYDFENFHFVCISVRW